MRRHFILIPLAALLAITPLILGGCSCGHDFTFHLQSWLDAAAQLRHGAYPHWAFSPAFHAGEPRFTFYPPLSWLLGALLLLSFPVAAAPALYTFLALAAAGFAMYRLAAHFVSSRVAMLAAMIYLANPYMLFNAFERTAYAELLAAAWVPLLFLAVLRAAPTAVGIAIPLALLWLTNAPAAVMGSYTLALLGLCRVLLAMREARRGAHQGEAARNRRADALKLAITYTAGGALGLGLCAFYLVPAAYERRYVQIAMAIIPNMRIEDNFLFGHTADVGHNTVLHTASLLATTLLTIMVAVLAATFLLRSKETAHRSGSDVQPDNVSCDEVSRPALLTILAVITALIALLLTPISLPVWRHLPELAFLQFSWRLLTILAPALALAIALLLDVPGYRPRMLKALTFAAPLGALILGLICIHIYRQQCDITDTPAAIAAAFATDHGVPPTDEYTPTAADNDVVRPDEPAYWTTTDANAFAPNTTPNPGGADPDFDDDFPANQTISATPPAHFMLHVASATNLVLNLRAYPNWRITDNHQPAISAGPRDDGLIALPLMPGEHTIDIAYTRTPDQTAGLAISTFAVLVCALLSIRGRARRLR